MMCALGLYRALFHLGLMEHVDAISSVSGGSWASSIYMFANWSEADLLGILTTPEELYWSALNERHAKMAEVATIGITDFVTWAVARKLPSTLLWPLYISQTILGPFGLGAPEFMASGQEEVERITKANPSLKGQPFRMPQPGRPKVFVMGGAFLGPLWYDEKVSKKDQTIVSLQMSPDYTGSPFWANGRPLTFVDGNTKDSLYIGGGLVETFAFGSSHLQQEPQRNLSVGVAVVTPPPYPFCLAEAVGISSDAIAAVMKNMKSVQGIPGASGLFGAAVPDVTVWPFLPQGYSRKQWGRRWNVGDGGLIENTGLLPLLQRGATRIVMMISSGMQLGEPDCMTKDEQENCKPGTFHFCGAEQNWTEVFARHHNFTVDSQLSSLFGYAWEDQDGGISYNKNQVFDQSEILPLLCEMQELKLAGKPIVLHKSSLRVKANTWWGLKGGNVVDVTFCYLEQATEFENRLPEDTRTQLRASKLAERTDGELKQFPQFTTTGEASAVDPFKLTRREANLLAAQVEYSVRQNEQIFTTLLQRSD